MESLARGIAASVEEHAPPKAGEAPSGSLADALKGRQLLYMKTANGFSDEEHVYLCSNGQAAIRSESSAVSFGGAGTATYAGTGGDDGTWTLQGNQVVMDNWWVQPQDQCR